MKTTPTPDELWALAHAALDGRRDPLDDPRVRAACEAHPAEALQLVRSLERLACLERAQPASGAAAHPGAVRRVAAAAPLLALVGAACALVFAGLLPAPSSRNAQPAPAAPSARSQPTARGEVLHFRMTLSTESPAGRRVVDDLHGLRAITFEPRDESAAPRARLAHWTQRASSRPASSRPDSTERSDTR